MSFQFIYYIIRFCFPKREKKPDVVEEQKEEETNDCERRVENCNNSTNHFEMKHSTPVPIPSRGWGKNIYGIGTGH